MNESDRLEWYLRLPPEERWRVAWETIAKIETALMVEFLEEDRPHWQDAIWVRNVPRGPKGIPQLLEIIEEYGSSNVTTGNANPPSRSDVGVYVEKDVLKATTNVLREYLSREES